MYRPLYLLSSIFVLGSVVLLTTTWERSTAVAETPPLEPLTTSEIEQRLDLADSSRQRLQIVAENGAPFEVPVSLDGQDYSLDMRPYSVRSADFALLIADDAGIHEVVPPESRTYRGVVRRADGSEVAGSVAAGSMSDGKLTATIDLGAGPVWFVQSLADEGLTTDATDHVVFEDGDVRVANAHCGVTDEFTGLMIQDEHAVAGPERSALGTGFKVAEIAFDADYHYFLENGSSATTTLFDIENVMNSVEFVYERDTDITYEITAIVVRTTLGSNPYSSSNCLTLLCQFRSQWNSVFPTSVVRRDVAHLMTGRNLGGCVGIAWVGVVCNISGFSGDCGSSANLGYGLSESRFTFNFSARIALTAHELGHNWNAPHCDTLGNANCDIMCSIINSCGGFGLPNFESSSISRIVSHRNSRNCLFPSSGTLADPIVLPFIETFPSSAIDASKWIYTDLVLTSTAGVGEPSATRSLNLDSTGSGDFDHNEIRSNFILLQGQAEIQVVYWTEHRGVESGERLVVEYWGSNRRWNLLNTIVSDGITQEAFDQHVHKLTLASDPQALHNEFRIRFRTEGNESTDDWYVDDVCVGSATDCGLGCEEALDCDDDNDCTTDTCESSSCVNTFNTEPCDDGDPCTSGDTCDGAGNCMGTPECVADADCNDSDVCTADACVAGCCENTFNTEPCDDGAPCTSGDTCDGAGNCAGTPECVADADCNDSDACTTDACVAGCCENTFNTEPCDDDDSCTSGDTCDGAGNCVGPPECVADADCNDNDVCTTDACVAGCCENTFNTEPCDDGDACTSGDTCDGAGNCAGTPECVADADCADSDACTTDACVAGCCENTFNTEPCDDDDPCTSGDTCDGAGNCAGTPECLAAADCNDNDVCTADACVAGCCENTFNTEPCDDDDACTSGDTCDGAGNCAGTPECVADADCNDTDACTTDACVAGCCESTFNTEPCDDGDACTSGDTCDGAGNCAGTPECVADADCNDNDVCTADACVSGCCENTFNTEPCDDDDACTSGDTCDGAGNCAGTPECVVDADCNDKDICTADTCGADGCCVQAAECDDGNACTVDSCDPGDGACTHDPMGCPEGESCNPANGDCVVSCPEDLDTDGSVRVPDLIILLGMWGPCAGCPSDFDGNGEVRVSDLIILLAAWGSCS